LTDLASQREGVASWKTVEETRLMLAEATKEWMDYKEARGQRMAAEGQANEAYVRVSEAALEQDVRGDPQLEGAQVYNRRIIQTDDRETLRAWVTTNMPAFLVVDEKGLMSWLAKLKDKELEERLPAGMTITRTKAVRVASDLSAYFPGKD
jgi:hypothetical protein